MAGVHRISVERGTTFSRVLTWKIDDVLVDLTGYTAKMEVRKGEDADVIVTLTTADSSIVLGGALGTITLSMSDTVTSALPRDLTAEYALELTSGGGEVTRLIDGSFVTDQEITK